MSVPSRRFPLLVKFLDAASALSVQVHPDDARAARLDPPDAGKTEAWVVCRSRAGQHGLCRTEAGRRSRQLTAAIREGRCPDCLHAFQPSPGDCIFVPAGTVHLRWAPACSWLKSNSQATSPTGCSIGTASGRTAARGRCTSSKDLKPSISIAGQCSRNIHSLPTGRKSADWSTCDKFVLDRCQFDSPLSIGGDDRFHIMAVLEGAVQIEGDPANALPRGGTALLPAALEPVRLSSLGRAVLLDAYLP